MIVIVRRWLFYLRGRFSRLTRKLLLLRELSNLLMGGTIVETRIDKEPPVLRTIIQLDGDIMTFVASSASLDESICKRHWDSVEYRLGIIAEQLSGVVRLVTWSIGVMIFLVLVGPMLSKYPTEEKEIGAWVLHILSNALPSLLIGLIGHIPLICKILGRFLLKCWLRRHIRNSAFSASLRVGPSTEQDGDVAGRRIGY